LRPKGPVKVKPVFHREARALVVCFPGAVVAQLDVQPLRPTIESLKHQGGAVDELVLNRPAAVAHKNLWVAPVGPDDVHLIVTWRKESCERVAHCLGVKRNLPLTSEAQSE